MKSHKNTRFLIVIAAIFVLVYFSSCGGAGQRLDPKSIEEWILGTSVSIREDFSPETFVQLKEAGIDYAELVIECLPRTGSQLCTSQTMTVSMKTTLDYFTGVH